MSDHGRADLSYGEVQRLTYRVARGLQRAGVKPGDKVAVLSGNDSIAFACVFGISRAARGLVPDQSAQRSGGKSLHPRRFRLQALLFHSAYAPLVEQDARAICRSSRFSSASTRRRRSRRRLRSMAGGRRRRPHRDRRRQHDLAMIAGTGGTTGQPKGVMLSERNLETMSALDLDGLSVRGPPGLSGAWRRSPMRPAFCACRSWRSAGASSSCPSRISTDFLELIARRRVTHTFLPPTLIYMLLSHPKLAGDRSNIPAMFLVWRGADVAGAA